MRLPPSACSSASFVASQHDRSGLRAGNGSLPGRAFYHVLEVISLKVVLFEAILRISGDSGAS
jgi:hypothetical protein